MDIRFQVGRRSVLLVALGAALLAGGVAYAKVAGSGDVLTACRLNSNGSLRLIDPTLSSGPLSRCTANETQVSWNEQGQPGAAGAPGAPGKDGRDGVSPTVAQLAAGDAHCAAGGAAITDASGSVAYVCNGADGAPGKDGAPFNGTFTSPNGAFTLTVSDSGVSIIGPDSLVSLPAAGGIVIRGGDLFTHVHNAESVVTNDEDAFVGGDRIDEVATHSVVKVGLSRATTIGSNDTLTVHGSRTETIDQAQTSSVGGNRADRVSGGWSLRGNLVGVNDQGGGCKAAARIGDAVNSTQITGGSATVCIGG